MDIIQKLQDAGLKGRGGAGFPTWQKWDAVKNAVGDKKYIIVNGSEGEPDVFKDKYILEKYPNDFINGIKIALDTIKGSSAIIYLNKEYHRKFKHRLEKLAGNITFFEKPDGYICGEETTMLNNIESNLKEPRQRPPYPTESGLYSCPTLINNIETFYYISKIAEGNYQNTRFYSISGIVKNPGVYEFDENWTVEKILKESKNYPEFDFFAQVGGGVSGEILLESELLKPASGAGSIIIFSRQNTDLLKLMKTWAEFLFKGNCDKCAPCREGTYRILQILKNAKDLERLDKATLEDIFFTMDNTSFCPLGRWASLPFKTLIAKLL